MLSTRTELPYEAKQWIQLRYPLEYIKQGETLTQTLSNTATPSSEFTQSLNRWLSSYDRMRKDISAMELEDKSYKDCCLKSLNITYEQLKKQIHS